MWIRSQSLAVLVKVNEVCIEDKTKIWAEGYLIGKYSTEEKALLVLDMIEKVAMYPGNTLFQMPADDEVVTVKKRVDYAEFRMLEQKEK